MEPSMCRNRDGKVFAGGSSGILHPINCYMHLQINCTHASVRLHAPDLRGGGDDTVRKCSVPAGRLNIQEERVATKRELWRPGGAGRNFLWCQNIATPLAAVWYHFTVLLPPLWSPRFPMCDWKCVCVFSTNLWMM